MDDLTGIANRRYFDETFDILSTRIFVGFVESIT